jgi:hypothetical protein
MAFNGGVWDFSESKSRQLWPVAKGVSITDRTGVKFPVNLDVPKKILGAAKKRIADAVYRNMHGCDRSALRAREEAYQHRAEAFALLKQKEAYAREAAAWEMAANVARVGVFAGAAALVALPAAVGAAPVSIGGGLKLGGALKLAL